MSSGAPARRVTRLVFFAVGVAMSAWAPLVPYAKARSGLDDGGLGLLLLSLGTGSMLAMPVAGALVARHGCRVVILVGGALVCLALPVLAVGSSVALLCPALLVFGGAIGAVDVTMNIQALAVERAGGRAMMSGFHGLYSAGGVVGAAGIAGLLGLGAAPIGAIAVVVAGLAAAFVVSAPHLLRATASEAGPAFAVPRGIVLVIGLMSFVLFLTEGAVLDWSGVFLTAVRGVPAATAGLGYAAFCATMTLGRLRGDRVVERYGPGRILTIGSLIAVAALAIVALVPSAAAALAGYALLGVGCSNIVPVLFSAAGRQKVMPEAIAVPAITTIGYAGILLGPAAIGFVAHATSLPLAILCIAGLLLMVAVGGRLLFRPDPVG